MSILERVLTEVQLIIPTLMISSTTRRAPIDSSLRLQPSTQTQVQDSSIHQRMIHLHLLSQSNSPQTNFLSIQMNMDGDTGSDTLLIILSDNGTERIRLGT